MTTGFFGKIPAAGDFVTWNLPRILTDRWDRWMSMELRDRPETGDLNSLIWRFAVAAGVFSEQPCAGAWRMSEDRVGRRYPFAIIRIGPPPEADDCWYDGVASMLDRSIAEGWSPTQLQAQIGVFPDPCTQVAADRIAFWTDDSEMHEFVFADIYDLADRGLPAMRNTSAPAET